MSNNNDIINVIIGGLGTGKTIFLHYKANEYYNIGYNLYLNYIAKNIPSINLNSIEDFLKIDTKPNFFGIDEGYLFGLDSRRSQSFMNLVSSKFFKQARKKKAKVYITSQNFRDLEIRIRGITTNVYQPKIIKWDSTGKPSLLRVRVMDLQERKFKVRSFLYPLLINFERQGITDICDTYDTYQVIEEIEDGFLNKQYIIIEKYKDKNLSAKDLTAVIHNREGLKITESRSLADYIKFLEKEDES